MLRPGTYASYPCGSVPYLARMNGFVLTLTQNHARKENRQRDGAYLFQGVDQGADMYSARERGKNGVCQASQVWIYVSSYRQVW